MSVLIKSQKQPYGVLKPIKPPLATAWPPIVVGRSIGPKKGPARNGPGLLLKPYTTVVESLPPRIVAFILETTPPYGSLLKVASNESFWTNPGGWRTNAPPTESTMLGAFAPGPRTTSAVSNNGIGRALR